MIMAGERGQGIGQSQELNQGCPMQWSHLGRAADHYWVPSIRNTAQITLDPHGVKLCTDPAGIEEAPTQQLSADPAGIVEARPAA